MFIEVRIVSPAVELESIIYEDSLGKNIKPFFTFMEQSQEEDIDMERCYNLHATQRKCSYESWIGRVCLMKLICGHITEARHGSSVLYSLVVQRKNVGLLAIHFGPRFLQQSPAQLAVQLGFFPLSKMLWIADGTLKSIFWSVCCCPCWAISIANNANNGRDWNEDKSNTFVHSLSAHAIALFHRRMLISLFGCPFYTVFGHK